jgi:membrane protease subunit HflK
VKLEADMRFIRWLLLVLLVVYLLTGVVQVRRGERAVVRRFGRVLAHHPEPGLWIGLPWGMDRVDRVEVDTVRSVSVGWNDDVAPEGSAPAGQLLTGDHNLVNVQVVLYFKVRPEELSNYVVQADRVGGVLGRLVESSVAQWVAGRGVDEVLLRGKNTMRSEVIARTRQRIVPYRLGVEVLDARIALVAPPDEVKDAFDSVARAQTGIATARFRAEQDSATRLRMARAERYRIEQSAAAYAHDRKVIAEQDARRFLARLKQYQTARDSNPDYLRSLWQEERGKVFATMKDKGLIDLLDHHLGQGGLDVIVAPRLPEKR